MTTHESDPVADPMPVPPTAASAEMRDLRTWSEEVEDSTQDEEP